MKIDQNPTCHAHIKNNKKYFLNILKHPIIILPNNLIHLKPSLINNNIIKVKEIVHGG